jgi:hypothetical protein
MGLGENPHPVNRRVRHPAIYTTLLNGYIFSLDVSAPTPEKIAQVVTRAVKLSGRS